MKLSATQQRALGKLTRTWKSARELRETLPTLRSLVHKGFAQCDSSEARSPFSNPRWQTYFRRHLQKPIEGAQA